MDMHKNVAFGYLAVLLGILSTDATVQKRICLHLEGGTIAQLLGAIEEFWCYHQQVVEKFQTINADTETRGDFDKRLHILLDRLRQDEVSSPCLSHFLIGMTSSSENLTLT